MVLVSGAKLVVGWIRIGGKKDRETIERTEIRQRVKFKNEQYKKPRKKTKSSNSTVYSTMRQTSLCSFISLKTTCTEQWGDSSIYSNNRN